MINQKLKIVLLHAILLIFTNLKAQETLLLGGGFQTNANLFIRDSQIGAFNIPQYDHQLFGSESWLDLNASYQGFSGGIRFDAFNNSNLLNPVSSYTEYGIGKWYIQKETDHFEVQAGYIYDQIGSGIIYRAYEERAQLIDNALIGVSGRYKFNNNWAIRGFTGKQRNLFESYNSILKGIALNGFYKPTDSSSWSIAPGFGFVNRTLGEELVTQITSIVGSYEKEDQFEPYYNSNAFTVFNNLSWKDISWYVEAAFKPKDIYYDPNAIRQLPLGQSTLGKLVSKKGSVLYTSLSYTKNQFGLTLEAKRTEGFSFRSEPLLTLNKGLVNFIPPMAKINTYRLTAIYYPATQFLDEMAFQADLKYGLGENWFFSVNYSNIRDKDFKTKFYNEIYLEVIYKNEDKWQLTGGIQRQVFNQELYYSHIDEPDVETFTPFAEFLYKFNRKTSLRIETQYMDNKEDIGSWIYGLAELGFAPHWLIEVSDMYNTKPTKGKTALNYPSAGLVFSKGSNRFALRYTKQIEGIICSGGICRLEPAFSGIRASITSTF
ncbi:MAG: hypothetical protein IPO86_15605 [Saprospiraceae bacterium]|nr:hypothetical protein [Saprospiraceae bacterium]MBK9729532.1 hypothetical protein [Saprospiraceae bacterium]